MVDCNKCGKKIGFFEQKYSYEDKKGNDVKYCSECNRKFEEKEKAKKAKEEKIKRIEREGFSLKEIKNKLGNTIFENFNGEDFLKEDSDSCCLCQKWESANEKIGNFNYCRDCLFAIKKSYSDLILDLYSKLYYNEARILNLKEFESSGQLGEHERSPLNYNKNKSFMKKVFVEKNDEDVVIRFNNYKVNYDMDRRLLHENQIIKKRQQFNSEVFSHLFYILFSIESIPAYPTFSSKYNGFPNLKKDPLLFQNKKLRIEYLGNSIDKKGNDVVKKFAEVIVNLKKLKGLNLPNIFKKDRWDLVLENIEFKFDKFPDGVDGYVGDYGDVEGCQNQQSIGIDINANFVDVECPICSSQRKFNLTDLPKKGESIGWACEDCEEEVQLSLPDESYVCPFCNKDCNSLTIRMKHIKNCKERLKNIIECPKCKLELTLDENELKELEKNNLAKISCPCKNKFSVKRKNGKLEIV